MASSSKTWLQSWRTLWKKSFNLDFTYVRLHRAMKRDLWFCKENYESGFGCREWWSGNRLRLKHSILLWGKLSSVALDLSSCKCSSNSSDAAISNCGSFYSSATTILDCREARVEYCRPHKMKSSSPSWSAIPNRSTMSPNRTHPVHVPAQYRKQGKTPSRRPRVSKIFLASTNFQQSLW